MNTETGWTKEFPTWGAYWSRGWPDDAEDAYEPIIVTINALQVPCVFRTGDERGIPEPHVPIGVQFLGPISPSDFEQLAALRKAAEYAVEWIEAALDYDDLPMDGSKVLAALREALKEEK